MSKRFPWLLCWIFCHITSGKAQQKEKIKNPDTDSITVKVMLSGLKRTLINFSTDDYRVRSLDFSNPIKRDTIITKYIFSNHPVHLRQLNLVFNNDTKTFTPFEKNFLLQPGDIIKLNTDKKGNFQLISYQGKHNYINIDSLLNTSYTGLLNETFFRINPSNIDSVKYLMDSIDRVYADNNKRISHLYRRKLIGSTDKSLLEDFNLLLKYHKICNIKFDQTVPKVSLERYFKEPFQFARNHLEILNKLNTPYNRQIIIFIIQYEAAVKGLLTKRYWDYFDEVDKSLLDSDTYKTYLISTLRDNPDIKNATQLQLIIQELKDKGVNDDRFDSLLAKKRLAGELRTYQDKKIINSSRDTIDYYSLVKSLNGKYVFVDFWASWCGPCRMQIPYLRKVENDLVNEDIVFVSISADKDEDAKAWIAASKDEHLYNKKFNYRLLKGNNNKLLEILNIRSLPRYILYDKNGEIVDDNFTTPNSKSFKAELMNYINNKP